MCIERRGARLHGREAPDGRRDKAIPTTLGYALLTLLAREAASGYDIARYMKDPIGFFWHARHSQIYPELARLEAEGLVRSERIEQFDRPDKKMYTITEEGLAALKAWATEPSRSYPERDEFLLKVYSLWLADREKALAFFKEAERRHRQQLREYERRLAEPCYEAFRGPEPPLDSPTIGDYLALTRGIGYERNYIEWCGQIVALLERRLQAATEQ